MHGYTRKDILKDGFKINYDVDLMLKKGTMNIIYVSRWAKLLSVFLMHIQNNPI